MPEPNRTSIDNISLFNTKCKGRRRNGFRRGGDAVSGRCTEIRTLFFSLFLFFVCEYACVCCTELFFKEGREEEKRKKSEICAVAMIPFKNIDSN